MFRSTTIIRELVLSLAKVILKHPVKYVVIYYVVVWKHAATPSPILIKVHLLLSELYRYRNARCNVTKKSFHLFR
jgi:hypothetical protein